MGLLSFLWGTVQAAGTIVGSPDPADVTDATAATLAAADQIIKIGNFEAVGVSLAGGGAWGLGHIGLLRRLEAVGLPTHVVAGVSSGAVVAAFHAWKTTGGVGIGVLEDHHRETLPVVLMCMLSMRPLRRWVINLTGGTLDTEAEAKVLNFHTRVDDGSAFPAVGVTLGQGVAASSVFPMLFAPMDYMGEPIIDGGFSANLPPETEMWAAGAGYFIASNPIPPGSRPRGPVLSAVRAALFSLRPGRRIRDFTYGVFHLLRNATDAESDGADIKFEPDLRCWGPADFDDLKAIAARAEAQATHKLSGKDDPAWAYHKWMWDNATFTGVFLGPPPPHPPAPTGCP